MHVVKNEDVLCFIQRSLLHFNFSILSVPTNIPTCFLLYSKAVGVGSGGGGDLSKFNTGYFRPEVQPLTLFIYTILQENVRNLLI